MALFDYPNYGNGYGQPAVINYPPVYSGGNNGGLFGGNGGDWLGVLFLIALLGGGWGNGFGGNNGYNGYNLSEQMQDGFNHNATISTLAGLQNSVTTGFSNAEVAGCNRAMDNMKATYDAQIANMQNNFNNMRDIDSRLDNLSYALDKCCCENKQAIADVKYTISQDGMLTRQTINDATRALQDKLCQLELDGYKQQLGQAQRDNIELQNRINLATLEASQLKQTKDIEDYIRPPINPTFTVANPYASYSNCNCGQCGNVIGGCA